MKFKTQKEIILSVRHDVPKLLGFQYSSMYVIDEKGTSLCAISLDEESDKIERENYQGMGFEKEYLIDTTQIVRFPTTLGLTGLAFQNNAVTYLNECHHLISQKNKRVYGNLFSINENIVSIVDQA